MKFISDGTWYDKGEECKLLNLVYTNSPEFGFDEYKGGDENYIRLFLKTFPRRSMENISGLFSGPKLDHQCGPQDRDEEVCTLDEFDIYDGDELISKATCFEGGG